jgi:ribosomal protein S9
MDIVTCVAPTSTTTRCTRRAAVTLKVKVPGGYIKGPACASHISLVQAMIESAAATRQKAARAEAENPRE